jgi:hypothetical protein
VCFILDSSAWQDEAFFRRMFGKLVEGLDLFYKGRGNLQQFSLWR